MIARWADRARRLHSLLHAQAIAWRDPRTPTIARIAAACVLGYLDDVVLLPLGVALTIRLFPAEVWVDAGAAAGDGADGAALFLCRWLLT